MKRTSVFFGTTFLAVFSIACSDLSKDVSKQQTKQDVPCTARYVPVGNNPEIALDTQTGFLCRTVAYANDPEHKSDKYASLLTCGAMARARDPQGKLYEAPAGTPLPAGWKAVESVADWKKSQEGKKWNAIKGVYE